MLLLTKEELRSHQDAKVCHICGKKNLKKIYRKVRDHCRYTKKYIGAAQNICNLKFHVLN